MHKSELFDKLFLSFLVATIALGAFLRFSMLSAVGLLDGDDFFYYRWAYGWYSGNYDLFGLYRLTNPVIGALGIYLFGVNDYSLHFFVSTIGTANILLSFILCLLVTRNKFFSLAVPLFFSFSLRIIEVDRYLIPYTVTQFFFLFSCIFFVFYYNDFSSRNTSWKSLAYIFFSGTSLSAAALTHWDTICHIGSVGAFIIFSGLFSQKRQWKVRSFHFMTFMFGFASLLLLCFFVFSPDSVINGLFNVKSTLQVMSVEKHFSVSSHIISFFQLLATISYKNIGSYIFGFLLASSFSYSLVSIFGIISRKQHLDAIQQLQYFPIIFLVVYFFSVILSGVYTYIRHWHAQHLSVLLVIFTVSWINVLVSKWIKSTTHRNIILFALAIIVFIQIQPIQAFTSRFHTPTPYRAMGDVLTSRVNSSNRVLIAPYLVLDFRYQTLTPPSYLLKKDVDHIFEYSSDLNFSDALRQNNIRYLVIASALVHEQADTMFGVKANLGRVYGMSPDTYSLQKELEFLKSFVTSNRARLLYSQKGLEIYDLFPDS